MQDVPWNEIQDCHTKSTIQQESSNHQQSKHNLRRKLVKCYIWSTALYGGGTWTLWKVDQKYLGSFEMWCWRRLGNIVWTDREKNEEAWTRVKVDRNILHTIKSSKGNILRRNCLLKHFTEGNIEVNTEGVRDEVKDVSSYWITLRKWEDVEGARRKL
jgi:hypothetical protein